MCTLILGLDILGPGSLLLGANRDESRQRPSTDPQVLMERPWVVGGRDFVSGGTWLAVREARFVTALMNRRRAAGDTRDVATLRSRGLLCLDVAAATGDASGSFLDRALQLVRRDSYAHCTLVGVGVDGEVWALHAGAGAGPDAGEPSATAIARGWHVITHQDVDDLTEPRTKWLLNALGDRMPPSVDEGVDMISRMLRVHGDGGTPAVCLHRDLFPTVSSSILALGAAGGPRYLHSPGPPCVTEYRDFTPLLSQPRRPT